MSRYIHFGTHRIPMTFEVEGPIRDLVDAPVLVKQNPMDYKEVTELQAQQLDFAWAVMSSVIADIAGVK